MSLGSLISKGMRLGRSSYRKETAVAWPFHHRRPATCRWRSARGRDTQSGPASRVEDLLEHLAAAYTKLNLTRIGS